MGVNLEILDTKLHIDVKTPFQNVETTLPAQVILSGILDSNTEGIEYYLPITPGGFSCPDPSGTSSCPEGLTVEDLLPGRYLLQASLEARVYSDTDERRDSREPGDFIGRTDRVDYDVKFMPLETYVEIGAGVTLKKVIDLQPVPALVHVQLLAAEDVTDVPASRRCETASGSSAECRGAGSPVYVPKQQDGVVFEESWSIQLLPPELSTVDIAESTPTSASFGFDTDEEGRFTAELLPGSYGVRIPAMDGYTGYSIDVAGDFSEVIQDRVWSRPFLEGTRRWPSPDVSLFPPPTPGRKPARH